MPNFGCIFSLNIFSRLAQVAKVMLAIAIYITHPLQLYVAIDIIWNEYLAARFEKCRYQVFYEYVVRTSLVLITCEYKTLRSCYLLFILLYFQLLWLWLSRNWISLFLYSVLFVYQH